jgi:hypothetical protein
VPKMERTEVRMAGKDDTMIRCGRRKSPKRVGGGHSLVRVKHAVPGRGKWRVHLCHRKIPATSA